MECLFTTFLVIFDIIAIVDATRSRFSVEKKVLWIALVTFSAGGGDGCILC